MNSKDFPKQPLPLSETLAAFSRACLVGFYVIDFKDVKKCPCPQVAHHPLSGIYF
jgi:hypothetical protein